ncbi:MAG: putative signal transduction protein [Myxococcaceae bacterium]|nr:putative signal transduction protein [Myxococcaceae bacterium]
MFSRLWRWAVPNQAAVPKHAAVPTIAVKAEPQGRPNEPMRQSSAVTTPPTGEEPQAARAGTPAQRGGRSEEAPFFEQLELDLPGVAAVPSRDEPLITELVMRVVAYVRQKKVDPPVVPALVPRVLAIVGEPEVDLVRLSQVIQQDLAISAKLLSVANSALFGGQTEITTVRQAISHLGTEQVAQVAIGLACRSSLESGAAGESPFAARWKRLFHHAMTCAFAAAHLAGKTDREAQESAFLGGLFHDVGKAVALRAIEALIESGQLIPLDDAVIDEALQRIHAYPGDEFYEKWTLPESLMQLCAGHHQLDDVGDLQRNFYLVSLISSFDALLRGDDSERRDALKEARQCADRLGLSEPAARAAYDETKKIGERTLRMFGS